MKSKKRHKEPNNSYKKKSDFRKFWDKFWFVVWKDDSIKGWIITIVFLFIIIKFIFFPILSLITGTTLPLAIVESCSMYHDGNLFSNFDEWWDRHESQYAPLTINNLDFMEFTFTNGFNKGDILFIVRADPKDISEGDVIIFHRVVDINIDPSTSERTFTTKGDNVEKVQSFEQTIREDQIIGKAVFKLAPYLGWGKLIFFEPAQPAYKRGFCTET